MKSRNGLEFEFDEKKGRANKAKHSIDFIEAQELWLDPELTQVKALTEHEQRYVVIGRIEEKHWSAIITYRGDVIRLISARRAREKEVWLYESR